MNIAHRGASAYAPENTFAAYDLAVSLGADAIELDVQQTCDGELVVIHDDTVTRTTTGRPVDCESIKALLWNEISQRDSGTWFNQLNPTLARSEYAAARVPKLDEVFSRYGDSIHYLIELKHPPCRTGMEEEIVDLVTKHDLIGERKGRPIVMVAAFSQPCLHELKNLESQLALVQLFHAYATPAAIRSYLGALPGYCHGVGPYMHSIDEGLVVAARLHGLSVYSWTANDPADMKKLIELGVDGVVTDYPDRLETLRAAIVSAKRDKRVPSHA